MASTKTIKSTCSLCFAGCGILIRIENDEAVSVKGDPESPVSQGVLCPKGSASLEFLYHPERLKAPLMRAGDRGEGKWKPVSWDLALDCIAKTLNKSKNKYGAESVAFVQGAAKGLIDTYNERLAHAFGTPNLVTSGHVCFLPRLFGSILTYGYYSVPDYDHPPGCLIIWGANLKSTRISEYKKINQLLDKGTDLVVIDPVQITLTSQAGVWLQLKPGSDLLLALSMIHVIVNEKLFDKAFINNWTIGFKELEDFIKNYSPEEMSQHTWIPAETIKRAARLYAQTKPAAILWGNAVDFGVNSFQTARAISILRTITGNLDVPGGDLEPSYPVNWDESLDITLWEQVMSSNWEKRIDAGSSFLPLFHRVLPRNLVRAIIEEKPYPIRNVYVHASNPLVTFDNSSNVYRALKKLDFLAVSDWFMTPTAAMADIVLPASTFFEFDNVISPPYYPIAQIQQKVATIADCRSDFEITHELSKRLNLDEYFWDNIEDFFDLALKSSGLSFAQFKKKGAVVGPKHYKKYVKNGFNTPSGKVELFSNQLAEWGFNPLPRPVEDPLEKEDVSREYPLLLISQKSAFYLHSCGRQIRPLRNKHKNPTISIHPRTAGKLLIKENDWVHIETKTGTIRQRAHLSSGIDQRVVVADIGWWFPETEVESLFNYMDSNFNILTDDDSLVNPEIGSGCLRGIYCKVYK